MKKKVLIILLVLFIVVASYFIGKQIYWNYKVAHAEKIVELTTDKITIYSNYNKKTKLSSIIKNINGKLDTDPVIKTEKLGKQTIKFKYTTDEGYPVKHSVEIEVVDNIPPMISYLKSKTIYTDFEDDLAKSIFCGDNYDPNPKCTIEGEYDTKTPGTYNLKFIGEDSSGNKSSNNFTLNVKKRPKSSGSNNYKPTKYTDFNEIKSKHQGENVHFGIDVSHWQGDINFEKVKNAGVEFVYIRVGRGNGIGKEYVEDDKFLRNIKGFNEVGIPVGIYFYSYANSKKDAENEAKWLIEKTKDYKIDLEIVFDWENWADYQYYNLSFYDLKEMAKAFNKEVKKHHHVGMLYSSKNYLNDVWYDIDFPVWVAHYTSNKERTNYTGSYDVWQLCDDGKVDGISGLVDLDIRYGSLELKKKK